MLRYCLITLIFISLLTTLSCEKEKPAHGDGLIGRWQMTERLADPGDGSGTFQPVSSNKTLEFHTNGTVSSNGSLCHMSTDTGTPSTGTYSLADSTIQSDFCVAGIPIPVRFKHEGRVLIVSYPCIEPCLAKFEKR